MGILNLGRAENVVRIVRLQGMINSTKRGLNLLKIENNLYKAFDIKKVKPKAVCLEINCPGGSPVQSNLIYQRIRNLSKSTGVPVLSFAEDRAVSGGYLLALAGDEIFVDPNSLVGSIGVLSLRIGLVEIIKKLGIDSRIITVGENKFRMDPFKPLMQEDVDYETKQLQVMHNNFIDVVKARRPKLDANHTAVFSGDAFLGRKAVSMGLADGLCSDMKALCLGRYGMVKFEYCAPRVGFLSRFTGFGTNAIIELSVSDLFDELVDELKAFRA